MAEVFDIIHELNSEGTTILLVKQNAMVAALSIAHQGNVLEFGRMVFSKEREQRCSKMTGYVRPSS